MKTLLVLFFLTTNEVSPAIAEPLLRYGNPVGLHAIYNGCEWSTAAPVDISRATVEYTLHGLQKIRWGDDDQTHAYLLYDRLALIDWLPNNADLANSMTEIAGGQIAVTGWQLNCDAEEGVPLIVAKTLAPPVR